MKVNLISETTFTVRGHGVHTAFDEMRRGLEADKGIGLAVNQFRKADITHIHTVGLYSLLHLLRPVSKKVVSVHVVPDSFVGSLRWAKLWYPLAKWYLGWFYRKADKVLAVSDEVAETLSKQLKVNKDKITVFYNTIDTSVYRNQKPGIRNQKRKTIISIGQIQPRKRFDLFLDLVRQFKDTNFIWVGGIPFGRTAEKFKQMKQLVKSAPDNVKVTGVIEHKEVAGYIAKSDIFILPSEHETHGIAVVEAASGGLPVLLRDLNVYNKTFGANALYASGDRDFKYQLGRLLKDKNLRNEFAKKSKNIADKFDTLKAMPKLKQIYKSLIQ